MKEEQKYFIMSTILFIVIAIIVLKIDKYHDNIVKNNYIVNTNKIDNQYINVNDFGIYLQNKSDRSLYDKKDGNEYPTQGYVLNEDRTTCYDYHNKEIKGQVHQTDEGNIRLETTTSIYCQMYFDIDEDAPTIESFSISGTDKTGSIIEDYTYGTAIKYTITWSDSDVVSYCITESDSCSEYIKTNGEIKIDSEYNLINTSDGEKTITVYLKDRAQNISIEEQAITLDRTAPKINKFSITGSNASGTSISDNSIYTHTPSVTYKIEYNDDSVDKYCIGTSSSDCTEWKSGSNPITTNEPRLVTGDGQKKMYAFIKDKAGNISTGSMGTITLDENNPTASMKYIESSEDSITVQVSGEDKVGIDTTKMYCRVKDGKDQKADEDGICVIPNLEAGQTYTIEAYVYDLSGRKSDVINKNFETVTIGKTGLDLIQDKPNGLSESEIGGLYRYVGTCDAASDGCTSIVDNFVCFGTDTPESDCNNQVDSEYMYRIIGIDPSTGDLKLIKNTAIREGSTYYYVWNNGYTSSQCGGGACEWPNVDLYKRLNGLSDGQSQGESGDTNLFIDTTTANAKYLTSGSKWYNMIKDINWLYGDMGEGQTNKTAEEVYAIETGKTPTITGYNKGAYTWKKTEPAKIGLMNVSDYYYSKAGNKSENCYNDTSCKNSWLHISNNGKSEEDSYEWTIAGYGRTYLGYYGTWNVTPTGSVSAGGLYTSNAVRPVFFLDSAKVGISGSGTVLSPFIVSEKY